MADIFISYAHEDETRIQGLVLALEKHGWYIFWDRRIPAGKTWHSYIGRALSDAKCVVVAWSQNSITSEFVIEEANLAKKRDVIVPVRLDHVDPPFGFTMINAADLTDWKLGQTSPNFDQLIQDITGVIGGKPPRPAPDEMVTPRTETESPPHEPALAKPEPLKVRPPEAKPIKPEPPKQGKKRSNFLIGAMIALAIAVVAVWALWASRESPRPPKPTAVVPIVPYVPPKVTPIEPPKEERKEERIKPRPPQTTPRAPSGVKVN